MGYSVHYRQQDVEDQRHVVQVTRTRELYMFIISQLFPLMSYDISVVAINEAGTGVYSSPISVKYVHSKDQILTLGNRL